MDTPESAFSDKGGASSNDGDVYHVPIWVTFTSDSLVDAQAFIHAVCDGLNEFYGTPVFTSYPDDVKQGRVLSQVEEDVRNLEDAAALDEAKTIINRIP